MAEKRKSIVFPYYNSYHTSTAIIIYQCNLLRTLNYLPDHQKPSVIVWHTHVSPLQELTDTGYPYLRFINIKHAGFRFKKLCSVVLSAIGLPNLIRFNTQYDIIYPAYPDPFQNGIKEKIFWKADFQESYYPQYFSDAELTYVKDFFLHLQKHEDYKLVLSSKDAWNDLKKFYPSIKNDVLLFRFVSHIPAIHNETIAALKEKFSISKPYFIVCNQFWPHKNHICIIEALHLLKQQNKLNFQVVFTGKTSSIRSKDYFPQLLHTIHTYRLQDDIIITDFLDRNDQLVLMNHSMAIVQPTLFEGWSTVIEDAKALNKYVIASNIQVNIEQLAVNATFFDPADEPALATVLFNYFMNTPELIQTDYMQNILASVKDLEAIFNL